MARKSDSDMPTPGKRVLAALVSYVAGRTGVDSTLKQLRGREIQPEWEQIAEHLLHGLMESVDPKKKKKDISVAEAALQKPPTVH
jgi:hypothetical protein